THLAQLLENKGKIIAIDRSKPRIKQLKRNLERLNIKNVEIFTNKDINYLRDEYKESIDKVLIDPPCSSIGVRPKLYDLTTEKEILDCARYQKNFLHLAHEFLKPDGIAIYSTCTLEPEENELNIKYAVENLAFEIIEQDYFLGLHGERTQGLDYLKLQRFYPNIHDYTGYFIAKLRKK
ncbi:MAG: methyltransferase domain-containing protein, partial [Candidatus Helarchaeota archaeon]